MPAPSWPYWPGQGGLNARACAQAERCYEIFVVSHAEIEIGSSSDVKSRIFTERDIRKKQALLMGCFPGHQFTQMGDL